MKFAAASCGVSEEVELTRARRVSKQEGLHIRGRTQPGLDSNQTWESLMVGKLAEIVAALALRRRFPEYFHLTQPHFDPVPTGNSLGRHTPLTSYSRRIGGCSTICSISPSSFARLSLPSINRRKEDTV